MKSELQAMEANNTWEITQLPKGKKVVGCKWVFKIKYLADGSIEKVQGMISCKGLQPIRGNGLL